MLQSVWNSLLKKPINKDAKEFYKQLKACGAAREWGGNFEHSQWLWICNFSDAAAFILRGLGAISHILKWMGG